MNNSGKPIGMFDSGLGGLTAVKAVRQYLPNENIIYLGDSARIPYGDKPESQILQYVCSDVGFLMKNDVKAIVIACNTADCVARKEIMKRYSIPVIGVVEPAAIKAVNISENKKIGVIATQATVKSGTYEKLIKRLMPDAEIFSVATPKLVPLIEAGKFRRGSKETEEILEHYLTPLIKDGIDTLILGCTHYPLVYDIVSDLMPGVNIICSGTASVEQLKKELQALDLLNTSDKAGEASYYVTGDVSQFEKCGGLFIGENIEGKVKNTVL